MLKQKVQFVAHQEVWRPILGPKKFTFTPGKGWVIFQKICFWFLSKVGAYENDGKVTIEAVEFFPQDFVEGLCRQQVEVLDLYAQSSPAKLLIGRNDFRKIISTPEFQNIISFTAKLGSGTRIMDMEVVVIPWMDGMIVVPESALGR